MSADPNGRIAARHPALNSTLPDLFLKAVKAAIIGTDLSGIVNFWKPFARVVWVVAQKK